MKNDETSTVNLPFSDQHSSEKDIPVYGVAEISQALKLTIEHAFKRVRVRGEISGLKRAASGHIYFSLKDDRAILDVVCWRRTAARIRLQPDDGIELVVTGRLTTYPMRSRYQIVAENFEFAGEGALLKLLEDRRRQLAAEGLFDPERKRKLPFLPDVIGVITSLSGVVIRDILHRLADRFPSRVLVWPVLVQGEGAAEQIVEAIQGFNGLETNGVVPRPDLLIVARGGGGIEDMWVFNEEVVARAVAQNSIPLISAIGHETDMTLIDFVADVRAPTPTAAAEMAVPVRHQLITQILESNTRLNRSINRVMDDGKLHLGLLTRGLPDLPRSIGEARQRLDEWRERFRNSIEIGHAARQRDLTAKSSNLRPPAHLISHGREQLSVRVKSLNRNIFDNVKASTIKLGHVNALLESYSYERVLERGFAIVTDENAGMISSIRQVEKRQNILVRLTDGSMDAKVTSDPIGSKYKAIKEEGNLK